MDARDIPAGPAREAALWLERTYPGLYGSAQVRLVRQLQRQLRQLRQQRRRREPGRVQPPEPEANS
jgi:hypothetical protein